jgi:hypothetical protein
MLRAIHTSYGARYTYDLRYELYIQATVRAIHTTYAASYTYELRCELHVWLRCELHIRATLRASHASYVASYVVRVGIHELKARAAHMRNIVSFVIIQRTHASWVCELQI